MKISDLRIWVVRPDPGGRTFVFFRIDTDAGVSGVGEATSFRRGREHRGGTDGTIAGQLDTPGRL